MKNHYIHAILELIQSGADLQSVLAGLKSTLETKGHTRLYASILRGVLRVLETSSDSAGALVTLADEKDAEKLTEAISRTLKELGVESEHAVYIDKNIIGGFIANANNKIVDQSYKSALTKLYRATTN